MVNSFISAKYNKIYFQNFGKNTGIEENAGNWVVMEGTKIDSSKNNGTKWRNSTVFLSVSPSLYSFTLS